MKMSGANENSDEFKQFLELHNGQLKTSGVPTVYWSTLFVKLNGDVFDAGDHFRLLCYEMDSDEKSDECKEGGEDEEEEDTTNYKWTIEAITDVKTNEPNNIFLIDHAWTYRPSEARQQLQTIPGLQQRMANLMGVKVKNRSDAEIEEDILSEMWKYNQTYSFGHIAKGEEEAMPVWYIMDEFGSRIQHSETANCRTVPFFWATAGMAFTLMWPIEDLEEGDEITRDYVESELDPKRKKARLFPWEPCDMKNISFEQKEPDMGYFECDCVNHLDTDLDSGRGVPKNGTVKVYVEYEILRKHLTDKRFEHVNTAEEADIIWMTGSWLDFKEVLESSPEKMINMFPRECVVTNKGLLPMICRRVGMNRGDSDTMYSDPDWLPKTYSLQTELEKFISYFQHREEKGLDNHWICKPFNLARGLDIHISSNLNHIIRLPDSGPKVACKYVEDPVLFSREEIGNVKFDVRYVLLLSSVSPLKLYVYEVFWLRFANKPFSLDHFDDYEKHFTVMNYVEGGKKLKQVHYDDFIPMFETQYPDYPWNTVEEKIFEMFRGIFRGATSLPPPQGLGHNPHSRALYAVDLLLKWSVNKSGEKNIQPVLCEVNFMPDCDRACKYHPFFSNDVFSTLFLDDTEGKHVKRLI